MLVEFTIHALDATHQHKDVAQIVERLKATGLRFQLGPMSTCVEGSWNEIFMALRKCHEETLVHHGHVITTIVIDDARTQHSLADMVRSVELQVEQDAALERARSFDSEC